MPIYIVQLIEVKEEIETSNYVRNKLAPPTGNEWTQIVSRTLASMGIQQKKKVKCNYTYLLR